MKPFLAWIRSMWPVIGRRGSGIATKRLRELLKSSVLLVSVLWIGPLPLIANILKKADFIFLGCFRGTCLCYQTVIT